MEIRRVGLVDDGRSQSVSVASVVTGTTGHDFIHVAGDAHVAPSGYNVIASATNGDDTIDPGKNVDIVYAGGGNDRINLGSDLTVADRIDGENGDDTVALAGQYDIALNATTLVNVEKLLLGAGYNYRIVTSEETVAAGKSFTVDGSGLSAANRLIFDASHDTDGIFYVRSGAGGDSLVLGASAFASLDGGAGDDTLWMETSSTHGRYLLSGGTGDDRLIGGDGTNNLNGGDGNDWIQADMFQYATTGVSFIDGGSGDDYIELQGTISKLTGGAGVDTVSMSGAILAMPVFSAASTGVEKLDPYGGPCFGDQSGNVVDLSGFVMLANPMFDGAGGNDILIGNNTSNDEFWGGTGDDVLSGLGGDDYLVGGAGHNQLSGGDGNDHLLVDQPNPGVPYPVEFDVMNGDAGDDTITLRGTVSDFAVHGGAGNDFIEVIQATLRPGSIDGGSGTDTIDLQDAVLNFAHFTAASFVGIEQLKDFGQSAVGTNSNNELDFSGFKMPNANGISLDGRGGDDILTGTKANDGLLGSDGNDTLNGGAGDDGLIGGAGKDVLNGGAGHDRFIFQHTSESTGPNYDTIVGFDGQEDTLAVHARVAKFDTAVSRGVLSTATFDHDLTAAVGAKQLLGGHAILFTPNSGTLAHSTFLVVDVNGVAGYQSGQDLVIDLVGLTHGVSLAYI